MELYYFEKSRPATLNMDTFDRYCSHCEEVTYHYRWCVIAASEEGRYHLVGQCLECDTRRVERFVAEEEKGVQLRDGTWFWLGLLDIVPRRPRLFAWIPQGAVLETRGSVKLDLAAPTTNKRAVKCQRVNG